MVEPNVVSEDLIRACIQIEGHVEGSEDKKRNVELQDVTCLIFSFKNLNCINNLRALNSLTKLQLDNNIISKIENLDHLSNLTWLDLSFNNIVKIEGLERLAKMSDLSLFGNAIKVFEGLDSMVETLTVLSIGNNALSHLEGTMYLRTFKRLRLVNLAGNPLCGDPEYRSYILSHLPGLRYLDYRLVDPLQVAAAHEQYQDEMLELEEAEEGEHLRNKAAAEKVAQAEKMAAANLAGVEDLYDSMLLDPELVKLKPVPNLLDSLGELREKMAVFTEEFIAAGLEQNGKEQEEHRQWRMTVDALTGTSDSAARKLVANFERDTKRAKRGLRDEPNVAEARLKALRQENEALQDELMTMEMRMVDAIGDLVGEFDRNYSEVADGGKASVTAYFGAVRELEATCFEKMQASALAALEKASVSEAAVSAASASAPTVGDATAAAVTVPAPTDSLPEEARAALSDKDALLGAIQACHDSRTGKIDELEDKLVKNGVKRVNSLVSGIRSWESSRNRDRVAEVWSLLDRNARELDELLFNEESEANTV